MPKEFRQYHRPQNGCCWNYVNEWRDAKGKERKMIYIASFTTQAYTL